MLSKVKNMYVNVVTLTLIIKEIQVEFSTVGFMNCRIHPASNLFDFGRSPHGGECHEKLVHLCASDQHETTLEPEVLPSQTHGLGLPTCLWEGGLFC